MICLTPWNKALCYFTWSYPVRRHKKGYFVKSFHREVILYLTFTIKVNFVEIVVAGEGDGIGGVLESRGAPKAGLDHDVQLQAAARQSTRKWPGSIDFAAILTRT
jgi:hypothetical protein